MCISLACSIHWYLNASTVVYTYLPTCSPLCNFCMMFMLASPVSNISSFHLLSIFWGKLNPTMIVIQHIAVAMDSPNKHIALQRNPFWRSCFKHCSYYTAIHLLSFIKQKRNFCTLRRFYTCDTIKGLNLVDGYHLFVRYNIMHIILNLKILHS